MKQSSCCGFPVHVEVSTFGGLATRTTPFYAIEINRRNKSLEQERSLERPIPFRFKSILSKKPTTCRTAELALALREMTRPALASGLAKIPSHNYALKRLHFCCGNLSLNIVKRIFCTFTDHPEPRGVLQKSRKISWLPATTSIGTTISPNPLFPIFGKGSCAPANC